MTSKEIRQQFLDFFKNKEHRIVDSSPVVPYDDPTLLFTNAGMNQFKDIFLGTGTRDYKRAADTQKCIRVSGKHNDLEEVGYDTYHHTFFEMLGNWSFGDYYKEEAIKWAWELLTEVWKIPKERLWATVYRIDDEAFELWKTKTDINPDHILRFDEKDNFWEMGETGPCGPSSEIHINISDDYNNPKWVNAGEPECIEIWNLVFIQYNKDSEGTLHDLPSKHVDTGMGFERLCAVIQGKDSNYDTDVFVPLIEAVTKLSKRTYENDDDKIAMRVIADHVRTLTFAIADGAAPSNEGRGYVLRRILRRAARYGRKLDMHDPFLFKLVDVVVKTMGDVFPEIGKNKENIKKIIKAEEVSFNETLDRGIALFDSIAEEVENFDIDSIMGELKKFQDVVKSVEDADIQEKVEDLLQKADKLPDEKVIDEFDKIIKSSSHDERLEKLSYELEKVRKKRRKYITGEDVFKLYDTFGFPDDLVKVMAQEKGLKLDLERFDQLMQEQKERARRSTKKKVADVEVQVTSLDGFTFSENNPTIFNGYDMIISDSYITGVKQEDKIAMIILDESPFYVESGGQIDDIGALAVSDKLFEIFDVAKVDGSIIHFIKNADGFEFKPGMDVLTNVAKVRRWDIMRNHSATHIMHAALREVIGEHVQQSGSYVGPDRLRFDFTHFNKLTDEKIYNIEKLVNSKIRANIEMTLHRNTPFEEARKMGALMFFGDKYGDIVNVVQFGDFSMEFCGGTHVKNSSEIGLFKIVSESSIASGVRKIEAVTGFGAERYIKQQEDKLADSQNKIEELTDKIRKLEKQIAEWELKNKLGGIDGIVSSSVEAAGMNVFKGQVEASNMDELKSMADELRNKIKSGVGLLLANFGDKVGIVAIVSDDLLKDKTVAAGKIVGEVAKLVGGAGGGRPHMATAGGKNVNKIDDALNEVENIIKKVAQK